MYILIFAIIVVNFLLLYVTFENDIVYKQYAPKPQPGNAGKCPTGQSRDKNGKCVNTQTGNASSSGGKCPTGQSKDKNGKCVNTQTGSGGCPSGQSKDKNGKCVNTQTGSGGCPSGQSRDKNGKCVKTQSGGGGCPSGQSRDKNGKCVKTQSGGGGGGCPSGQSKDKNGKCVNTQTGGTLPSKYKFGSSGQAPTQSRLENAKKFFEKYPNRVNNPPDAYKGLIEAGYIQKTGNSWTVNTSPAGQPPVRVLGGGSTGGAPGGTGGSGAPGGTGGSGAPGGTGGNRLPKPKNANEFHNNSYGQRTQGNRLPDEKVKNADGYIITDPGNLVWQNGGRGCTGQCSMLNDKDAATVKKTIDQVTKNGGVAIGYMSLTIEPTREDIKGLKKGTDYTSNYMTGWDEYGPKLTPQYKALMKNRIDLYAKAGFKAMEFDNIDIINDPAVQKQIGATSQQWQGFVKDLVQYANNKGISVIQKNTPTGWGKDMNSIFAGAVVETKPSQGKSAYEWNQIQNMLEQNKPVFLNNENGNCDSVLSRVREWTGGTGRDNLIMGCNNK